MTFILLHVKLFFQVVVYLYVFRVYFVGCKFAYVGTYGPPNGTGKGIYVYSFTPPIGVWSLIQIMEIPNPIYMCTNRKKDRLYTVNELSDKEWEQGRVSSFRVDEVTGHLSYMTSQLTGGNWPSHLALDPSERFLLVTNYRSGSLAVFKLNEDGSIGPLSDLKVHKGCGPNKKRQEAAHMTMITFPQKMGCKQPVQVIDLGLDKIVTYMFDDGHGKICDDARTIYSFVTSPGSGPLRSALTSNERFLYVVNELFSTISVFPYKLGRAVGAMQVVSTLPNDVCNVGANSDIKFHPSEKFLYVSNRFNDFIAVYCVDKNTGILTPISHQTTLGKTPRYFRIIGNVECATLYVANQESNRIVGFCLNQFNGSLISTDRIVIVPSPAFIEFI